jgi:hypothetical protein
MQMLAFFCYTLSFIFQLFAAYLCFTLNFKITGVFRWAWVCLTIGLTLMLSRRVFPMIEIYTTGNFTLIDAFFALAISAFLSGGIFGIAKLVESEKTKNEALSFLSSLDPLTNCLSRIEIFSKISDEIERTLITGNAFSILEIDIDHFKDINDRYGHQVGDEMVEIRRMFTPEFRNRIDAIISFRSLDREIILRVVDKFLMQLEEQLIEKKVEISFSQALRDHLADKGFDPQMGARPMARLIQDTIRKALADQLLFGRLASGGR